MSWSIVQMCTGKVALGFVAAVAVAYAIGKLHRKRCCKNKEYRQVAELAAITIYPIKSCRGIRLNSAECLQLGLRSEFVRDREFMVVDQGGNFITARQEPHMILITPSIHPPNQLWLDAPEMETLKLTLPLKVSPTDPTVGTVINVRVFKDAVKGVHCGEEAAQWLSKYIGKEGVRLVRFQQDKSARVPDQNGLWERLRLSDNSIYADLTAYMGISEASLEDLNSRLEKKVIMSNFRPNFIFTGLSAFEEESLVDVRIGDVQFRQVKPCTRCVLTTVDPETGIKDGIEPLKTLKSYRQITDTKYRKLAGESPAFGVHLAADNVGTISVGLPIYATTSNVTGNNTFVLTACMQSTGKTGIVSVVHPHFSDCTAFELAHKLHMS